MRLKVLTTSAFLTGLVMLIIWPWVLGPRPSSGAPRQELARYGLRMLTYFGVTSLTFLVTAVLALMLFRQVRDQLLKETGENLHDLIEGTLRDHGTKDT